MLSKVDARKKIGKDSGKNGKLLHEIEAISKALYLDKTTRPVNSTSSSRPRFARKTQLPEPKSSKLKDSSSSKEEPLCKDKKSSIWSWKSLKAFTHVRNRRFNCCFSLQVHSIEGLPRSFDDLSLCVHWKRRDGELMTCPARVFEGIAEFDELLKQTCSVYGSRSGSYHSAKYEARHFLLYASVFGASEVDLGKHLVDLTRFLPLTLEELEEEKSSGKWTTSFRLSGDAKGATMNVSFGYLVLGDNFVGPGSSRELPEALSLRQNSATALKPGRESDIIRRAGSVHARSCTSSRSVEDIKDLHEILPISKFKLCDTVNMLYKKLDDENLDTSVDYKPVVDISSEPLEPLKSNSCMLDTDKDNVESASDDDKPEVDVCSEPPEPLKPKLCKLDAAKDTVESVCEVSEFAVVEHGTECSPKEETKSEAGTVKAVESCIEETPDLAEISNGVGVALEEDTRFYPASKEFGSDKDEEVVSDNYSKKDDFCDKESLIKELESAWNSVSDLAKDGPNSQEETENSEKENCLEVKLDHKGSRKGKSLSLDDGTETVAGDFLDMLGIEHSPFGLSSESEPESPRERLLRQFEKDTLANGCSLFNCDINGDLAEFGVDAPSGSSWGTISEDCNYSENPHASEEIPTIATQSMSGKMSASLLEDLESEALMRDWGLNEKAFQSSPPSSSGGFGSPIDLPPEKPLELPPLGEGLGSFVQTKNGGFLRSMNPDLFRSTKSGGNLIMQISSPVVVPAEMGSGIMEILQGLASVGIEKLSMQASKLMPLEDITGKTMQQIAWDAAPSLEAPEREVLLQRESEVGQTNGKKRVKGQSSGHRSSKVEPSSGCNEMDSEYVSLEDLAPLAMDKIEALSIEGLRIQSGMSDQDAPLNISPQSIGEFSALEGKRVGIGGSLGLEGAGGLQLLDIKDSCDDDGLMGLSLTLDEWMRLDSGEIDDEEQISERTSKILAAHHATCSDFIRGSSKGDRRRGKGSRKCGLLGNNFTVALMVQLRDPLRNYEPVGTPMLSLIQVERVFVPPKPKIYSTVLLLKKSNEDEEEDESEPAKKEVEEVLKEEKTHEEESIAQFKITEVHVAGLKAAPGKKKLWGSTTQQQSGSRWLLANGMGKSSKHPLMKAKAAPKSSSGSTTKVQPGDTLWSISSRVHGTGAKWKDLAALNPHIRNPNVIFPNETIKLR